MPLSSLAAIFDDIKIQHTLFALPFAIMSAFIASGGFPEWATLGLIALALLFARSVAMAFNRLVDEPFDKENPRTKNRALPAGRTNRIAYILFIVTFGMAFIITCGYINMLALKLAPLALLTVCFYSYTKRFTAYSHFFLGAALALAPVGAWIAVTEKLSATPLVLGLAVIFWLAGLDTIYSCQDARFDRERSLHSIPSRFGVERALKLAAFFHVVMVVLLVVVGLLADLGPLYYAGVLVVAALLGYEHSLVRPDDLSRVNIAFFNVNGFISVGLMLFVIFDLLSF